MKQAILIAAVLLLMSGFSMAANVEVKLDSNNGSSGLVVKSSDSTVVASIDSAGGIVANGSVGTGPTLNLWSGTRLMFYPKKAAFRAGFVSSDQWNDANIGDYSVAIGKNVTASNVESTAIGSGSTASGTYSTAIGILTTAGGSSSTAIGSNFTNNIDNSIGIGSGSLNILINSSGKVGIGTTNPQGKLHVATAEGQANLVVNSITGNVGVGTSNPSQKFMSYVLYNSNTGVGKHAIYGLQGSNTDGSGVGLGQSIGGVTGHVYNGTNYHFGVAGYRAGGDPVSAGVSAGVFGASDDVNDPATWGALGLKDINANHWAGYFNGNVYSSGNVGIGTTNPQGKLHVATAEGQANLVVNSTSGNVGIGTTSPGNAKLSVMSGNVGIGTTNPEFKLSLDNDGGIIAKGTYGAGATLSTSGAGTRLIWYPRKAAFRAGNVTGDQWDSGNISNYSIAMGKDTLAYGDYATAIGDRTAAYEYSTALGSQTIASGSYSTALGQITTASGLASTALGASTQALATQSTAMGVLTIANAQAATAMGWSTSTGGIASVVIGKNISNSNDYSLAIGFNETAYGEPDILLNANGTSYINADAGSVCIGTRTSPGAYKLQVNGQTYLQSTLVVDGDTYFPNLPSGTTAYLVYWDSGTHRLQRLSSSKRYKHDIRNYSFDINQVEKLNPVRFKWNQNNKEDIGLIAEDVVQLFPELVLFNSSGEVESIDYSKISVILLKDAQEKSKEINELKVKNQQLEDKNTVLEARVKAIEDRLGH